MKSLFSALFSLLLLSNYAQNKHCFTDEVMNTWFAQNPKAKAEFLQRQQEAKTQDSLAFLGGYQNLQHKAAAVTYTIPVVFHILHLGGSENISDAQINDAINVLNTQYQKLNADTTMVITQFKSLIADVGIQFALATKDPMGNCTNGITRHVTSKTNWISSPADYIYTWPPNQYLNIYVVKTIAGGTAAAYTFLPGTSPGTNADAVVSLHDYVGSIGTSSAFNSSTLTHEVGHWLNLQHCWGNTNAPGVACGDDGVSDTPITKGYSYCPSGASAAQICTAGITENYQNYMEYSYCDRMFTIGQANRMITAINGATAGRNNLSTNSNLIATGIINPATPCAPIANCWANYGTAVNIYTVCNNQSLTFIDGSYNGTITARSWSVTGTGAVTNPTAASTAISFIGVGTQTVTLNVSNSIGNSTTTKTVLVLPNTPNYIGTYQESFENIGLPANWLVINQTGGTTWQQYFGTGSQGNNSYYINGSINPNNAVDILQTPSYDFLNNLGATYTFKYAYAKASATNADVLRIQASSNCGSSWQDIYVPTNNTLASGSGGTTSTPFFPSAAQFKLYTLTAHPTFNSYKMQANVMIRFHFTEDPSAGFGNNIFLDEINFNSPAGFNELTQSISFQVYPNPTTGSASLEFTLSDETQINYSVINILGQTVEATRFVKLMPGSHILKVNEEQKLKSGVYFVKFEMDGQKISRKLIVE
jgi:hypothetical protein